MSRPRRKNRSDPKAAFTLVETVLAVTIFSFIAVSISMSFFSGMKLWGRAISTDSWRNDILLGFESISAELRQSVDVPSIGYSGDGKSVSFLTVSGNNVLRVSYYFDAGKKALIRGEIKLKDIPEDDEEKAEAPPGGKVELSLDEFSIRYLRMDPLSNTPEWVTEWEKSDGVFVAIRFTSKTHDEEFNKTVFIPIAQ